MTRQLPNRRSTSWQLLARRRKRYPSRRRHPHLLDGSSQLEIDWTVPDRSKQQVQQQQQQQQPQHYEVDDEEADSDLLIVEETDEPAASAVVAAGKAGIARVAAAAAASTTGAAGAYSVWQREVTAAAPKRTASSTSIPVVASDLQHFRTGNTPHRHAAGASNTSSQRSGPAASPRAAGRRPTAALGAAPAALAGRTSASQPPLFPTSLRGVDESSISTAAPFGDWDGGGAAIAHHGGGEVALMGRVDIGSSASSLPAEAVHHQPQRHPHSHPDGQQQQVP